MEGVNTKLQSGTYLAECKSENYLDNYRIELEVIENEKSYSFRLADYWNPYGYPHIANMFHGKSKITVRKEKSPHAMIKWNRKSFTIYPFRSGIPFYFERMET